MQRFSSKICLTELIETLHADDPVKIFASKLQKECENFDFLLYNSYNNADDLEYSLTQYKENHPELWELFFSTLKSQITCNENVTIFFRLFSVWFTMDRKRPQCMLAFHRQFMKFVTQKN